MDVHKLKKIFDLFELTTGVDAIIQQGDGMVEYSDFCALRAAYVIKIVPALTPTIYHLKVVQ